MGISRPVFAYCGCTTAEGPSRALGLAACLGACLQWVKCWGSVSGRLPTMENAGRVVPAGRCYAVRTVGQTLAEEITAFLLTARQWVPMIGTVRHAPAY